MQHVAATVRLNGDLNFAIRKPNLTVPEVVLLRLLHGADAIADIRPIGTSKRTLRAERDRLMGQYGVKPEYVQRIDGMFANIVVQPLDTLADIGVDPNTRPEPKPKPAAHTISKDDFKPYDASDDITPGDDEPADAITPAEDPGEVVDDYVAPAEAAPSAEEAAAAIEAGKEAARNTSERPRSRRA